MEKNFYVDRHNLSVACVEFARKQWLERRVDPTESQIAKEIGVGQPMISQILSGTKSLSKDSLAAYAAKLEMSFPELVRKLLPLVKEENVVFAVDRSDGRSMISDGDLLDRALVEMEALHRLLGNPKSSRHRCVAELFYQRVAERSYSVFHKAGIPIVSAAVCFQQSSSGHLYVCTEIPKRDEGTRSRSVVVRLPEDIVGMLRLGEGSRSDSISTHRIVLPARGADASVLDFWAAVTGRRPNEVASELQMAVVRAYPFATQHSPSDSSQIGTSAYSLAVVFVFAQGYTCSPAVQRAIWLLSTAVERIHSVELQERASSVARLCGLNLLPSDVRPHKNYYPNADACDEQLEHEVYTFLEALASDGEIGSNLATADVWSYDWTAGEFSCLSSFFRFVSRDAGERVLVSIKSSEFSLAEAYEMAFDSLKPRLQGKTSFILTSGRALIVEDPKATGSTGCTKHTELDIGTFLGLPLVLTDYQNDRRIYSVLYVRFRKVMPNPASLVAKVAKIAAPCRGILVRLAPAMTLLPDGDRDLEVHDVMHEPDRVLMVGSGPSPDFGD